MDGRASALSKRLLPSMDMKSRHKIHANHICSIKGYPYHYYSHFRELFSILRKAGSTDNMLAGK